MSFPDEIVALWRTHAGGLLLLARSRCANDAEDLVQDAFVRLARQPSLPRDPLAWLARTIRNLAVDHARQAGRRKQRERRFAAERMAWFHVEPNTSDHSAKDVLAELSQLHVEEREILVAHVWSGLSFEQIGEAFGMSSSTANRRYHSALETLRTALCGDDFSSAKLGKNPKVAKSVSRANHG